MMYFFFKKKIQIGAHPQKIIFCLGTIAKIILYGLKYVCANFGNFYSKMNDFCINLPTNYDKFEKIRKTWKMFGIANK